MSEHTLAPAILRSTIIGLHKAAFQAIYFDTVSKPGQTERHLDALLEFYSHSETLALHYNVKFGDVKAIDQRIVMLAKAGQPEPDNLGELEKGWTKELENGHRPVTAVCNGCGRNELHKMCPAWGTPIYCDPEHPEWGKATNERLAELREKHKEISPASSDCDFLS